MKKSRYTDRQIIALLKQAQAGTPVPVWPSAAYHRYKKGSPLNLYF